MKKFRISVFLSPEFAEQFKAACDQSGMSMSTFGSICIQLGYSALQMSTNKDFKPFFESAMREIEDAKK